MVEDNVYLSVGTADQFLVWRLEWELLDREQVLIVTSLFSFFKVCLLFFKKVFRTSSISSHSRSDICDYFTFDDFNLSFKA